MHVAMRIESCDDWWQTIFEWALMAVKHSNIPKGLSSPSNIAINLLLQGTRLPLWPQPMPSFFRGYSPDYQDYTSSIPIRDLGKKKSLTVLTTLRNHQEACLYRSSLILGGARGRLTVDSDHLIHATSAMAARRCWCYFGHATYGFPPLAPTSP